MRFCSLILFLSETLCSKGSMSTDCNKLKDYDLIMELNTRVGKTMGKEVIYGKSLIVLNILKGLNSRDHSVSIPSVEHQSLTSATFTRPLTLQLQSEGFRFVAK